MTERTIGNVVNEINEWKSRYGDFMYTVTAFFTDREVVSANKKDRDAALELRGLLQEVENVPQEFVLEQNGVSKAGNPKWKLVAFGPIDGPYTYSTLPSVQGGGAQSGTATASPPRGRSPELNTEASIRASVALKAAADVFGGVFSGPQEIVIPEVLRLAESFDAWLAKKASEPASSAYDEGGGTDTALPVGSPEQAGVGSETTSPVAETSVLGGAVATTGDTQSAAETADGGQVDDGEASACPPHDLDLDVAPKAMRYPCRKCNFWVKPTMAAEEAQEAAK